MACGTFLGSLLPSPPARAETPVLDRDAVERLVATSPAAFVIETAVGEARAARIGQGLWLTQNPELEGYFGPRDLGGAGQGTDVGLALSVPVSVSFARSRRVRLAEAGVRLAEAQAAEALWQYRYGTLDVWLQAEAAVARIALAQTRLALDARLLEVAEVRRRAGVVGEAEVALARAVVAEARAALGLAEAALASQRGALLGRLGRPTLDVAFSGTLPLPDAPPLPVLLAPLSRRPDVVRLQVAQDVLQAERALQSQLAIPVPRVFGEAAKEANDRFAHVGLTLPLPLFQRNQTARALVAARLATGAAEQGALHAEAEASVRGAHARWQASKAAYDDLAGAREDLERAVALTTRAYELGQAPLAEVLLARREGSAVREATLLALIEAARARLALEQAAYPAAAGAP